MNQRVRNPGATFMIPKNGNKTRKSCVFWKEGRISRRR